MDWKRIKLEATVEAGSERHQIARGIFYEINDMISITKAGLEIALDCVNPKQFKHVLKLTTASYESLVLTTRFGYCDGSPGHRKALRYLELDVLSHSACF